MQAWLIGGVKGTAKGKKTSKWKPFPNASENKKEHKLTNIK